MAGKKENLTEKVRENPWIISTFVLGILTIILIVGNFYGGDVISADEAGKNLVKFLNENAPSEVILKDISPEGNLYKVNVIFQGNVIPLYMTQDGNYFIQNLIPISLTQDAQQQTGSDEPQRLEVSEDDDAVKGDSNAPVTIIEFSDYQCPFCGKFWSETLPQITSEYIDTGKVKLVYRDFPLGFHENAQKAAEAAECAGEQGKYYNMHDKLFSNQDALDVAGLKKYAGEIGLNTVQFNTCLDSGAMADEVKKDFEEGQKYGVTGTPAFFINGIYLSGAQPFSEFQKIIEEELSNA